MAVTINGTSGIVFNDNSTQSTAGSVSNPSGYVKLPSGTIIQWGNTTTSTGSFSFPIAFPNACSTVVGSSAYNGSTFIVYSFNTTSASVDPSYLSGAKLGRWIAIGY